MFCPNCGAQNQDNANACAKCGHQLKSAGGPKFKGTMLMMNAPAGIPRPQPGAPAAPPAGPPAAAAAPAAPPAEAPPAAARPKLKGTMIGVAPPSLGSNAAQPAYGAPPPAQPGYGAPPPAQPGYGAPPPAQPGYGAPPPAQPGYGAPPPAQPGYGAPPPAQPGYGAPEQQAYGAPPQGYGAPAQEVPQQPPPGMPAPGVNPLGGTMVADAGTYGQYPVAAPPQQQAGYDMGGAPQGYGAPGQMPPQAQPMVPQQPMPDQMEPVPGMVGGRNPVVTVLLIVLTCGLYGIYLLVKSKRQPKPF